MRITSVQLCDAASVREGLLHVLGAGVTVVNRPGYPAPLGGMLTIQLYLTVEETKESHRLSAALVRGSNAPEPHELGKMTLTFGPADVDVESIPGVESGQETQFPFVLPGGFVLPAPGSYRINILLDDIEVAHLTFVARRDEQTELM